MCFFTWNLRRIQKKELFYFSYFEPDTTIWSNSSLTLNSSIVDTSDLVVFRNWIIIHTTYLILFFNPFVWHSQTKLIKCRQTLVSFRNHLWLEKIGSHLPAHWNTMFLSLHLTWHIITYKTNKQTNKQTIFWLSHSN